MFSEMDYSDQDKLFYPQAMKLQSNDQYNLIVTLYANTNRRLDYAYLMHSLGIKHKLKISNLITQLRKHGFEINLNREGFKLVNIDGKGSKQEEAERFKPNLNPLLNQVFQ